jgi:Putative lactococcus lactis phage r1t holin
MKKYLTDLAERTIASFAGGFLSVIGLDAVNVLSLDWKAALGVGGGAALVSFLKGLAAKAVGNPESASLSSKVG